MGHTPETRQRAYEKVQQRRTDWLLLNGPCGCGSWDDLEVDHIDPSTKEYQPSHLWSRRKEIRDKELAKCQVLCYECHKEKTIKESSERMGGWEHGSQTGYAKKKCRCELCTEAHRIHNSRYR